jgi:glycosyltransferase involved in cell wall biosynthesis
MRIAVWHNLPSGGGKRALYYHVKGLRERGHTLESWSLGSADHAYLSLRTLVPEHVVPLDWQRKVSNNRWGKLINLYLNATSYMKLVDKACRECARQINAGGFDLVFANSCAGFAMPFVVRYVQAPKVTYLQEPFRYLYEARPTLPWVGHVPISSDTVRQVPDANQMLRPGEIIKLYLNRRQAREEWITAHASDVILVNSYYSREVLLRVYNYDAQVCYLGIDTDLFQDLNKERERFIVGLGSFDRIKGIDLAIQAVACLPEPRPPLVWIGNKAEQRYLDEVKQLAVELNVDLRTLLRVSDAEIVDTLNRATLMLYTSRLEPFGLAPLEANACGTPVVAVAEGGVRETVIDGMNGYLVDREPQVVAAAMAKLLDDPRLAHQMGQAGATYVREKWTLERSIDRLEALLLRAK